jgi:hypothetical protein
MNKQFENIVFTQMSPQEVTELLKHPSEEVHYLADKWMTCYWDVCNGIALKTNILKDTSRLLTVDSQLKYLMEEQ